MMTEHINDSAVATRGATLFAVLVSVAVTIAFSGCATVGDRIAQHDAWEQIPHDWSNIAVAIAPRVVSQ